ncbi:MAG: SDR family NAD(P)-dependent oxidoreductase [Gammaproteobacteria bacterium]|nr:SDR family NAD(P)-dependent oxidoreductase [Gammaproteobacteria bacterium]
MKETALIVGAGNGLSHALAHLLHQHHYQIALAARNIEKLKPLADDLSASTHRCDIASEDDVKRTFEEVGKPVRVAVCHPSLMPRGPLVDLVPAEVAEAIATTAFGSFLVAQAAAKHMLTLEPINGCRGTILMTGASAGVKGFPKSAPFAMGKFAQRGLAQSMSRELHPQGIHVCWINIDGVIANEHRGRVQSTDNPDAFLEPAAIAQSYLTLIQQHRSAWSSELALRPWVESF